MNDSININTPAENRRKTCKWSKFDELWGDYKCKLFYIGLSSHAKCDRCNKYEAAIK